MQYTLIPAIKFEILTIRRNLEKNFETKFYEIDEMFDSNKIQNELKSNHIKSELKQSGLDIKGV